MVTRETQVEELMKMPGAIAWCVLHGVSLFSCAGAFPGTVGRLLELKLVKDIDGFLRDLNDGVGQDALGGP